MKHLLMIALLNAFAISAFAKSPFDQLGQIESAYEQERATAKAEEARKAEAARAKQQAIDEEYRRKKLAVDQRARMRALEINKARDDERRRLQNRDEKFEDEARALALEEKRLELEARKAKVARTNEYIDAELRAQAASTDVVQSEADATRNVSSGAKVMMESSGEAEVNKSEKWFSN